MQPYKLKREIQVNEKGSDAVAEVIGVSNIDERDMVLIFGHKNDDPFFYGDYEISMSMAAYFPYVTFDFNKYDYFLICWRELTGNELEILTINKFFKKDKAKRYVDFVLKPSLRPKFIARLAHLEELDYDKFRKLGHNEAADILDATKNAKIDSCYCISENKRIDGQFLDIMVAIQETIGYGMGTLLVFGSAEVVFYEGEEMNDRWLSL